MAVGQRFDFEAARREAQAKKAAEKRKAMMSNIVTAAVLLALAGGAFYGWKWWSKRQADAAEAEESARVAEESRVRIETQRQEAERKAAEARRKAEAERKEAERKAEIARREAEQRKAEEARQREAEEAQRQREAEIQQRQNRADSESFIRSFRGLFDVERHVAVEYALKNEVTVEVEGSRWEDLRSCVSSALVLDFLELLRTPAMTNAFSDANYPDVATMAQMKDALMKERFRVTVTPSSKNLKFTLVAFDNAAAMRIAKGGMDVVKDVYREADAKNAIRAFKFVLGDAADEQDPCPRLFVMNPSNFAAMKREFNDVCKQAIKDAERDPDRREAVINEAITDYLHLVKKGLETQVRESATKPAAQSQTESKTDQRKAKKNSLSSGSSLSTETRGFGSGSRSRR